MKPPAHVDLMFPAHTGSVRVLVVEDEPKMAALLCRGLREEGLVADVAPTGAEALWHFREWSYDVILLDLTLPDTDGLEVCRRLRREAIWTPVLMLTARDAVPARVAGLDAGADDYLTKPFSFEELLARVRALLRRDGVERPVELQVGDLRLAPASHEVWRGDVAIDLTCKEFSLLQEFMRRPGQVLTRERLLEQAWDFAFEPSSNVVDVFVRNLRDKVDRPFGLSSLETVRGAGYRLRADAR